MACGRLGAVDGAGRCAALRGDVRAAQAGIAGRSAAASWALQAGRLVSCAAAGALVAGSVSALAGIGAAAPRLRPLWTLLHVAAFALGGWLLWRGRAPGWLAGVGARVGAGAGAGGGADVGERRGGLPQAHPLHFMRRLPPPARAVAAGACWAAMPRGLLQSALLVAALNSGPLAGAVTMAGFALTSGFSLVAGPRLWRRFAGAGNSTTGRATPALAVRLAGAMLMAGSGYALAHGLRAAIDQALCA